MESNPCTITIGPVRFSYLQCFKPKAIEEGQTPKFSVSAIIPKKDKATIAKLQKAIETAKVNGKESKWGGKTPATLKMPLRDGDEERPDDETYKGALFINCHATTRPGVVDANRNAIIDEEEIGSGDYGYVNISLYPYASGGAKGVAAGFNHIMKTKTGDRLSGRVSVDSAFEGIELNEGAADLM